MVCCPAEPNHYLNGSSPGVIIVPGNGLSSVQCQAITLANADMLSIEP